MLAYISDPSLATLSAAIIERERVWNEANPRRWYISAEGQNWVCAQRELGQVRYLTRPSGSHETQEISSIQGEEGEDDERAAALLEENELDWLNGIDLSVFRDNHFRDEDESEDDDWYIIDPLDPENGVPFDPLPGEIIDKLDKFFPATSGLMTPVQPIELAPLSHSIDGASSPTADDTPIESGSASSPNQVNSENRTYNNNHRRPQAARGQGLIRGLERAPDIDPLRQEDHLTVIRTSFGLPPATTRDDIENFLIRNPSILHHLADMTVPTPRLASQTGGRYSIAIKDIYAGLARLDLARSLTRVKWNVLDIRKALELGVVPGGVEIGPKMGRMARKSGDAIRRRWNWKPERTNLADSQTVDEVEPSDMLDS